jgi:serine/threonine protein kinase
LKLCDLGAAITGLELAALDQGDYIVARLYRAPELLLGLPREEVTAGIDIWAAGVTIAEMTRYENLTMTLSHSFSRIY